MEEEDRSASTRNDDDGKFSSDDLIEIGNDLVRLGVCDKEGETTFSFSPEFAQNLTRMISFLRMLVSPKTPNKKMRDWVVTTLPMVAAEQCRLPLWACRYLLTNNYRVRSDTKECVDTLTDYLCFCYEILRRADLK